MLKFYMHDSPNWVTCKNTQCTSIGKQVPSDVTTTTNVAYGHFPAPTTDGGEYEEMEPQYEAM